MERRSSWDAIVVGSGLGGLTAAAYLQTNGRRTLVVEQYDVAGGSSHVFRRRGGFEFDVGVHYVGDCGPEGVIPRVLRGAGLEDRVRFVPMDRDGFDTLVFPEREFRVPAGWDRYRERLIEAFPAEERGLRRATGVLERIGRELDRAAARRGRLQLLRTVLRSRMLVRWGMRPLAELFDACELSDGARAVLAGESGDYGLPPSRAAIAVHAGLMDHYLKDGGFYPQGGGQVLAAHLVEVIRAHGGDVRTRARVRRILVEGGRVVGVELDEGERLRAPVVVSNADLKRTFAELLPAAAVPERTAERAARAEMALPLFCVYLGLDVDLREHLPNANIWAFATDDVEDMYRDALAGRLPDPARMGAYLTSATLKDPTTPWIAPPGHSSLEVMTLVTPDHAVWKVGEGGPAAGERYSRDPGYRAVKQQVADMLVSRAEELVPAIRGHIVWREAATPITHERYTLATLGTSYGLAHTPAQVGPRRPGPRTAIPGLFLAGASTRMGHGIPGVMLGGVSTAGAVLGRDLHAEIAAGRVFGDPARLHDPAADWDPFLACRRLSWKAERARRARARTSGAPAPR